MKTNLAKIHFLREIPRDRNRGNSVQLNGGVAEWSNALVLEN